MVTHVQLPMVTHVQLPMVTHVQLPMVTHVQLPMVTHVQLPIVISYTCAVIKGYTCTVTDGSVISNVFNFAVVSVTDPSSLLVTTFLVTLPLPPPVLGAVFTAFPFGLEVFFGVDFELDMAKYTFK